MEEVNPDAIATLLKPPQENLSAERHLLIAKIRRWGGVTTDALLHPACQFFSISDSEGIIGYRSEWGCEVVLGDPICAKADLPKLAQAFQVHCQKNGRHIIYLAASEQFKAWATAHLGMASIEFGKECHLDPCDDPRKGSGGSLVRRKVRHAIQAGITVEEYRAHDENLQQAIEQASLAWLKGRKGLQIHLSQVCLFADQVGKRWFYAKLAEKVVGVVVLNQLQAKSGWLLNHLMITSEAPHGTQEMLVIIALEALQREGCHFVSFGNVSTEKLGAIIGMGKTSSWVAHGAYAVANRLFHLEGLMKFWDKFQPQGEPSYLLFSEKHIGLCEVWSLLRTLNVL